jgi:microcystin-dependent protein
MADPFVAEIRMFPFNFAPRGWAFCNGQLLPLSQNTALFSLLGTTYGGDGKSNFALPNLQESVPMFWGQGPGLSLRDLGEQSGQETVTLLTSQVPSHGHTANAHAGVANSNDAAGKAVARPFGGGQMYTATASSAPMSDSALAPSGGGLPHNNAMPSLVVNFCIALQGVFPPRT